MGLKDRIAEKSALLVERENVTLPKTGETVVVRTISLGDASRANAVDKELAGMAIVAFCTEDPAAPGVPLYNWNTQEDRQALAALDQADAMAIINVYNRLAGNEDSDAALLGKSGPKANGLDSLPPASGFSLPTLQTESTVASS